MNWCHSCKTNIPEVIQQDGRTYYVILVEQSVNSYDTTAQSNALPQYSILRTHSEFRLLYKTLMRATKPTNGLWTLSSSSLYSRSRRVVATSCNCQNVLTCKSTRSVRMCLFDKLHMKLINLAFPARRLFSSNPRERTQLLQIRRTALMKFLTVVQNFFSEFSDSILEATYRNQRCAVMHAWVVFFNMNQYLEPAHESSGDVKVYHPLRLTAWHRSRQHESEKCAIVGAFATSDLMECDLSSAQSHSNQRINSLELLKVPVTSSEQNESMGCAGSILEKSSYGMLPTLNIQPLKVGTAETFLEDFCVHLLGIYGSQFAGVQISLLSEKRRWELSLYIVCCIGHIHAARLILLYHCDNNVTLEDGTTCLHVAARMGHTDIVHFLAKNGADVDCSNDAGITPLIAACRHGKVETVKCLVELGANISMHSLRQTYPLHAAVVAGDIDIIFYLISKGADVNVTTINGITPLHFAVKLGNLKVCKMLLRKSADVFHETNIGSNALMIAKLHGFVDLHLLLKRHAQYQRFTSFWQFFNKPGSI